MSIKIFKEKKKIEEPKPYPAIKFEKRYMIAVDPVKGTILACLFDFFKMSASMWAQMELEISGFNTDFAEWDTEGRMVSLSEDFEE